MVQHATSHRMHILREPIRPWRPPFGWAAIISSYVYTQPATTTSTLSRQPEEKFGVDPFWLGRLNLLDAHKYSILLSPVLSFEDKTI